MKKIILLQFFLFNIILLANAQCWKSVSQGPNFVLAIKTDGTLWAWGNGYYGVLGNGTNGPLSETNTPIQVGSDADWKTVSCGNASVMALKTNGTLWGWGSNKYYQLGNPGNDVYVPTQVGSNSDWSSLSCGDLEASAIKQDGTLWTWGSDYYNTGSNSIPTKVGTDNDWKSVASGFENTEIIKNNGTLWAWGLNDSSQLGDGTTVPKTSPVQIGTDNNWQTVSCLGYISAAIKTDGTLWSWGKNIYTGTGTIINSASPIQITGAADWQTVSVGDGYFEAIKNDNTLWGWGSNGYGLLGDGTTATRMITTQIDTSKNWQMGCASSSTTIALKSDNTLWTWGSGNYLLPNTPSYYPYQVSCTNIPASITFTAFDLEKQGYYTFVTWQTGSEIQSQEYHVEHSIDSISFSEINITPSKKNPSGSSYSFIDQQPAIGSNYYRIKNIDINGDYTYSPVKEISFSATSVNQCWQTISAGGAHSGAVKKDGSLWTWGRNDHGQLGDGTSVYESQPVQIGIGVNWKIISCGFLHTLAIKNDGTLWAWGYNSDGQLGNGSNADKNIPVQIGMDNNWQSAVAADSFSIALKTDGTLWAWGFNVVGELGDGTNSNKNIPIRVGTDNNWQSLATGEVPSDNSFAIKNDGTLWGWGNNDFGQIGDNTTVNKYSPVQVGTDNNWQTVTCGERYTLAIKTDGTLWGWGYSNDGETGTHASQTPVQVGTDVNWKAVVAGHADSHGLKTDGTLWGWGINTFGEMGDGNTNETIYEPVQIGADIDWQSITAGYYHNLSIKTDGSLFAWGENYAGQLGDATKINKVVPVEIPCGTIVLPVTIISFTAQKQNNIALLKWQAVTEQNSKEYQIERSDDGNTFNEIGVVASKNNISGSSYTYVDAYPLFGNNYYRLKMIDIDGKYSYSNLNVVTFNTTTNRVIVYPNPANDVLFVQSNFKGEKLNINITDIAGRKISQTVKANNQLIQLSTLDLKPGFYLLKITDGITTISKKIIKE